MPRPRLEIADIFRAHGPAWRRAHAGHVSLSQLRVMSAIETCRTEALGGHVAGCAKCSHRHIAYNSCKNRHCPKCQGPAARDWMAARAEGLGGPEAVLAYLSRYTHRVAISNTRLISADAETVAFRWKDYRIKSGDRQKVMRLAPDEFIRRFLIHVLPDGFHRIRHYGLLASAQRKANIARVRSLLGAPQPIPKTPAGAETARAEIVPFTLREPCPCCGGPMRIVEVFRRGQQPQSRAPPRERAA